MNKKDLNKKDLYIEDSSYVLLDELETYYINRSTLLDKHKGRYVLIKGTQVVGIFDGEDQAITAGLQKFGNAPIFVREITPEEPVIYVKGINVPCSV